MQQLTRQGTQHKQLISQLEEDLLARWASQQVCRQGDTSRRLAAQGQAVLRRAAQQRSAGGVPLMRKATCRLQGTTGMRTLGAAFVTLSRRCPNTVTFHALCSAVCLCHLLLPPPPTPKTPQPQQLLSLLGISGLTCHLQCCIWCLLCPTFEGLFKVAGRHRDCSQHSRCDVHLVPAVHLGLALMPCHLLPQQPAPKRTCCVL